MGDQTCSNRVPQRQLAPSLGSRLCRRFISAILQKVAGLTAERVADRLKGLKPDTFDFARFQKRDVLLGDADALRQVLRAHLAFRQHHIKINDDRHARLHDLPVFIGKLVRLDHDVTNRKHEAAKSGNHVIL
jgi:hypothetical protein